LFLLLIAVAAVRVACSVPSDTGAVALGVVAKYKCRSYLILSFNFQKGLNPGLANNYAVNIRDASNYFEKYGKVLKLEDCKLWKGIELIWKPRSNSYNIDPIMLPKNRIFNARRTKMRNF